MRLAYLALILAGCGTALASGPDEPVMVLGAGTLACTGLYNGTITGGEVYAGGLYVFDTSTSSGNTITAPCWFLPE